MRGRQPLSSERNGRHTLDMADQEPSKGQEQGFGELRHYVPADILNISFPVSVRGLMTLAPAGPLE